MKYYLIAILILIGIIIYLLKSNEAQPINYKTKIDSLQIVNDSLYFRIAVYKNEVQVQKNKLVVLENKKQKIVYKFKTKENEVKNYSIPNIILQFDTLLTDFN